MRIGLPDDHVAAARIHRAALVTRHHARGNARGTQQQHERARVVFAEAPPRVEQEHVDGIVLQEWRRQRIDECLAVEPGEHRAGITQVVRILRAQLLREFERARIAIAEYPG